jgi:hypothetical protein
LGIETRRFDIHHHRQETPKARGNAFSHLWLLVHADSISGARVNAKHSDGDGDMPHAWRADDRGGSSSFGVVGAADPAMRGGR